MRVAKQRLTMCEGCKVEVCYKEKGNKGIWYDASIKAVSKPRSKCRELCLQLDNDMYPTPLTKLSRNVLIRPVPPVRVEARIRIKKRRVVDAIHNDGWSTGLVLKVIDDDKFLVFLESPPDIIEVEREDLRPHLDWVEEKYWVRPGPRKQLWKHLTKDSMFSCGTMVEVSCKVNKVEVVWAPAMIIKEFEEIDKDDDEENEGMEDDGEEIEEKYKEIKKEYIEFEDEYKEFEEDDEESEDVMEVAVEEEEDEIEEGEKKYIVKFCHTRLNKTVGMRRVRPTPPPFTVQEHHQFMENVEVFYCERWYQGQVTGLLSQKRFMLLLKATNKELVFKHWDLRPLKVWEDGLWKTKESPLTQELGNEMSGFGSVKNGNAPSLKSGPPVNPSPGITAQPLNQAEAESQGKKTPERNQNGVGNDSACENEDSEDNSRKRKREQNVNSVASVEENKANDTAMDLPFEKKLPIWKTVESMEVFKTVPQTPHFSPLIKTQEEIREMYAVGMMFTYSTLLEEVKGLQHLDLLSTLKGHIDSFAVLEKHGFDVKAPLSQIQKLLSLKGMEAKKMEELIDAEKGISGKESEKIENNRKILELQRMNEEVDKKDSSDEVKPRND